MNGPHHPPLPSDFTLTGALPTEKNVQGLKSGRNPQHPAENNGIAPTSQYPKFTIIYCVLRMLNQGEMRSTHI